MRTKGTEVASVLFFLFIVVILFFTSRANAIAIILILLPVLFAFIGNKIKPSKKMRVLLLTIFMIFGYLIGALAKMNINNFIYYGINPININDIFKNGLSLLSIFIFIIISLTISSIDNRNFID